MTRQELKKVEEIIEHAARVVANTYDSATMGPDQHLRAAEAHGALRLLDTLIQTIGEKSITKQGVTQLAHQREVWTRLEAIRDAHVKSARAKWETHQRIDGFLRELGARTRTQGESDVREAVGFVFEHVDDMLLANAFDDVARLLMGVDVARLPPEVSTAFLAVTLMAKDRIATRPAFYERVAAHLRATVHDRAAAVLRGLE